MSVTNSSYHEVNVDIAVFQNLPITTNDAIDFCENQFYMIIEPLFGTSFLHFVTSECDSPFFANKCTIQKCHN